MQETARHPNAHTQWHEDADAYRELVVAMMRLPKPIISAVNGPALAGGAGIVLASDIVLAAPEATFGLPEPKRGIVAGLVAPILEFRIGGGRAGLSPAELASRFGRARLPHGNLSRDARRR